MSFFAWIRTVSVVALSALALSSVAQTATPAAPAAQELLAQVRQRVQDAPVVRGGFGVSYNRLPGSRLLESRFNPPFFAGFCVGAPAITVVRSRYVKRKNASMSIPN